MENSRPQIIVKLNRVKQIFSYNKFLFYRINHNWIFRHWIGYAIESIGMAKSSRNRPQEA